MTARPAARTFQDLLVWQKAHQFVMGVYRYSAGFLKSEAYGLASQVRRAAVSVPANIAEGFRKSGRQDKARFMNIAQGSLEERSRLEIRRKWGFHASSGGSEPHAGRVRDGHSDS
jgi:four helix bundle protein